MRNATLLLLIATLALASGLLKDKHRKHRVLSEERLAAEPTPGGDMVQVVLLPAHLSSENPCPKSDVLKTVLYGSICDDRTTIQWNAIKCFNAFTGELLQDGVLLRSKQPAAFVDAWFGACGVDGKVTAYKTVTTTKIDAWKTVGLRYALPVFVSISGLPDPLKLDVQTASLIANKGAGSHRLTAVYFPGEQYVVAVSKVPLGFTCTLEGAKGVAVAPGPSVSVRCTSAPERSDQKTPPMFTDPNAWTSNNMRFENGYAYTNDIDSYLYTKFAVDRPVSIEIVLRPDSISLPGDCVIMQAFPKQQAQRYSGYSFGFGFNDGPNYGVGNPDGKKTTCAPDPRATLGAAYFPFGQWSTYRLDIRDDGIVQYFVDGDLICQYEDNSIASGVVGIAPSCRKVVIKSITATPLSGPNLAGLWRFDEIGNPGLDSSVFANHLTTFGRRAPQVKAGFDRRRIGTGGLEIIGSKYDGGFLALTADKKFPNGVPSGKTSFTVAAWFKRTDDTALDGSIVSWGAQKEGKLFQLQVVDAFKGVKGHLFSPQSTVQVFPFKTLLPREELEPAPKWLHVAVTFNKTDGLMTIWANGRYITNTTFSGEVDIDRSSFAIGSGPTGESYIGLLDDVAIFDGVLASAQIQSVLLGDFSNFKLSTVDCSKAPACAAQNRQGCRYFNNKCGPCLSGFRDINDECIACKGEGSDCFSTLDCCGDYMCAKKVDDPTERGKCTAGK